MIFTFDEYGEADGKPTGMKLEFEHSHVSGFMHHDNYCGEGPATWIIADGFTRRVQPPEEEYRDAVLRGKQAIEALLR